MTCLNVEEHEERVCRFCSPAELKCWLSTRKRIEFETPVSLLSILSVCGVLSSSVQRVMSLRDLREDEGCWMQSPWDKVGAEQKIITSSIRRTTKIYPTSAGSAPTVR